jgi:predicted RND superfamily exporter protein
VVFCLPQPYFSKHFLTCRENCFACSPAARVSSIFRNVAVTRTLAVLRSPIQKTNATMIKHYFLVALIILFFSNTSFAQTQLEMNETANVKYKKADAELNKVYKQLMSLLDKNEKQLLIQAEKDWNFEIRTANLMLHNTKVEAFNL